MTAPYFRPLLKPTLWFLPAFVLLIALGTWQVERLHWKEALIAQVSRNMGAPAITFTQALSLPSTQAEYRRVSVMGTFDHAKENYAYTIDARGEPVLHVLTPLLLDGERALIVDRGAIPAGLKNPQARQAGQLRGMRQVTGIWHTPSPPNFFTPAPNLQHRLWFARDIGAIGRRDHLRLAGLAVVEADATPNPGGWPKGGQTVIAFPNNHLQYALTWFGLAMSLLAVYLYFHHTQGRLGWK